MIRQAWPAFAGQPTLTNSRLPLPMSSAGLAGVPPLSNDRSCLSESEPTPEPDPLPPPPPPLPPDADCTVRPTLSKRSVVVPLNAEMAAVLCAIVDSIESR